MMIRARASRGGITYPSRPAELGARTAEGARAIALSFPILRKKGTVHLFRSKCLNLWKPGNDSSVAAPGGMYRAINGAVSTAR
jgi:hypothetical protein